jgi:hypothetical protein
MNAPQQTSPRRRLQELLAIAESRRTDAQWDEIHGLEIELSSANREQPLNLGAQRKPPESAPGQPGRRGGAHYKQPSQKTHKTPKQKQL